MLAFAERFAPHHPLGAEALVAMRERPGEIPTKFTATDAETVRFMLRNDLFVFSMSASREHPLQWSHYADSHKGVCIHLDAGRMPIGGALRVDYCDSYPSLMQPPEDERMSDALHRCALTKAKWWEYEKEFRIVFKRPTKPYVGQQWPPYTRAPQFEPEIICGLTLGAHFSGPMDEKLVAWCQENRPDLQVHVASLDDTAYKLNFTPA